MVERRSTDYVPKHAPRTSCFVIGKSSNWFVVPKSGPVSLLHHLHMHLHIKRDRRNNVYSFRTQTTCDTNMYEHPRVQQTIYTCQLDEMTYIVRDERRKKTLDTRGAKLLTCEHENK